MKKYLCKNVIIFLAAAAVVCSALAINAVDRPVIVLAAGDGMLTVHFIDCGQADACIIEFPDGKNMLIDTGESKADSYGKVTAYIDELNIDKFDYFIMTHADSDHIGGVTSVFDGTRTADVVYRPSQICNYTGYDDRALSKDGKYGFPYETAGVSENKKKETATYRNALETVYEMTDEVYVIDPARAEINTVAGSATVNDRAVAYTFDFYSPLAAPYTNDNDYSPIMVLSYAGRNLVLSGDAEEKNEEEFVRFVRDGDTDARYDRFRNGGFNADLIKMGHHGSSTSSSEKYLDVMCPQKDARCNTLAIFSCGEGNKYAHPHAETLQRLMDMKFSAARIERTDLNGNIVVSVDPNGAMGLTHGQDSDVAALLTSGSSGTRPEQKITDNGVRPTEELGTPPSHVPPPSSPIAAFWDGLSPAARIVVIVVVAVVLLTLIVLLIVVSRKQKKRKRKRRGRPRD